MPVYGSVLYLFTVKFVTASFVFSVSTPHPLVLVTPPPPPSPPRDVFSPSVPLRRRLSLRLWINTKTSCCVRFSCSKQTS